MAYKFRTDGPWGSGVGHDLDPADVDGNFWQAIQDNQAKAGQGVGIANVVVSGSTWTVVLTDHTLLGPFRLPVAQLTFQGEWVPNFAYLGGSIITHGGSTYLIPINHVSEATFDPGANDGHGTNFYNLLLQNPAAALPTGGPVGYFLRKAAVGDFVTAWQTAALDDLSDVIITTPAVNDVLQYISGVWKNAPSAAASLNFTDLQDVAPSPAPVIGDLVTWNGSAFTYMPQYVPLTDLGNLTGTFPVDLTTGYVQFTMTANCTISGFIWPGGSSGLFVRRVIRVINSGSFTLTWPSSSKWPGGVKPTQVFSGTDEYILTTSDGGTTVFGNTVGQNYS